jgi:hypothetical protein
MDKKEVYREKLEAQLKEWKATIDMLEAKAAKATAGAKAEMLREIELLQGKKAVVLEKWNELQKASGEAWDDLKGAMEKSAAELETALDRVISRFK